MNDAKSFSGWVAVVTGGGSRLAGAVSKRLMERGVRCVLVDIDAKRLERMHHRVGGNAVRHVADLSDPDAVNELGEKLKREFGKVDILVNNAAITDTSMFDQRSVDSIIREINVNLVAPLLVTRTLLPLLQKAGDGRVISIASLGGIFPLAETSIYSASKFGLRGAMLGLGLDGPRLGVKIGIISPSAVETSTLMREAIGGGNKLQFADPPQQPEDVAHQVMLMLDRPKLERFTRTSESVMIRLVMLVPNLLATLIPRLGSKAEAGHRKYLASLKQRGLIVEKDGVWTVAEQE